MSKVQLRVGLSLFEAVKLATDAEEGSRLAQDRRPHAHAAITTAAMNKATDESIVQRRHRSSGVSRGG